MAALTLVEQAKLEVLRGGRAQLMDIITGLDDQIAEIEQTAAARPAGRPVRDNPQA